MFRRYWHIGLAIALGAIAVILLANAGYNKLQDAEKAKNADYEYQPARDARPLLMPKKSKIASNAYEPYCNGPHSRDDADLCAQWAAVQAVSESNRLARLSITITGLEFGALIVSLIFTGWAAMAAGQAARAAKESVEDSRSSAQEEAKRFEEQLRLTRETLSALQISAQSTTDAAALARKQFIAAHRPRVKARHAALTDIAVDAPIQCGIVFANVGDTPATTFKLAVDCFLITPDGEETPADNLIDIESQEIIPGRELRFLRSSSRIYNAAQLSGIRDGRFTICVSATLLYKDENGTVRTTGLCRFLDIEHRIFLPFPDERKYIRYREDEYEN